MKSCWAVLATLRLCLDQLYISPVAKQLWDHPQPGLNLPVTVIHWGILGKIHHIAQTFRNDDPLEKYPYFLLNVHTDELLMYWCYKCPKAPFVERQTRDS